MKNKFYTEFDLERLKLSSTDQYRTYFQVDRDRIIHSSEFRRLQGKTQVFLPGEYDYYRTRLTHSIEVSQIGRSICNYLKIKEFKIFNLEYYIDSDLVETACLAHDLGNPPFGHPCEFEINRLMAKHGYGGYEGNAQTLRLLTEIFYKTESNKRGMNPCRATIDSVLKYKATFSSFETIPKNHFIYDSQKEFIDFIFANREIPNEIDDPLSLNNFKSIECQIMDWSDDTAYSINDIVDGISGGFITTDKLERWIESNKNNLTDFEIEVVKQIITWIKEQNFKRKFSTRIGEFISACSIEHRQTFMDDLTNRYKYVLKVEEPIKVTSELYKRIALDLVFNSSQLHQIEFKGKTIIAKIYKIFRENYIEELSGEKILPEFTHNLLMNCKDKNKRARMICDYISGMTDSYALRIYKRLFDPDYSSLADLI